MKCYRCGKKGRLLKCKHCEFLYCKKHITPKLARVGIYVPKGLPESFKEMLEKDKYREDAHPCIPYTRIMNKIATERENEGIKALTKSLDKLKQSKYPESREPTRGHPKPYKSPHMEPHHPSKKGRKKHNQLHSVKLALIVLVILAVSFLLYSKIINCDSDMIQVDMLRFNDTTGDLCQSKCMAKFNISSYKLEPAGETGWIQCFCDRSECIDINYTLQKFQRDLGSVKLAALKIT